MHIHNREVPLYLFYNYAKAVCLLLSLNRYGTCTLYSWWFQKWLVYVAQLQFYIPWLMTVPIYPIINKQESKENHYLQKNMEGMPYIVYVCLGIVILVLYCCTNGEVWSIVCVCSLDQYYHNWHNGNSGLLRTCYNRDSCMSEIMPQPMVHLALHGSSS